MNIPAAIDRIDTALVSLETSIGETVFDEWALMEKDSNGWKLLEYGGSRKNGFLGDFNDDIAALRGTLNPSDTMVGDFAFSHEGHGTGFDAHICAGKNLYVLFNNTKKSTGDITSNPKWTTAQIHFSELLEAFISDPLEI